MKDVTFVLMTCGELTEKECLAAIKSFRDEIEFFEVRNVYPQIKALNQMIEGVKTEFFIPLDADMILEHDAWPRIKNAINKNRHNTSWHSILFNLWDTLTERKILALKILRSRIAKENLFVESATPDVEHYQRLTSKGYTCVHDYLKQRPIGKHVVRGKHFCYNKYRDVYQTYRSHNFEWDSGAFLGGSDLMGRAKAHFDHFLYKWVITENKDYLHCIAGMMDGIFSPVEHRSKSLEKRNYVIDSKWAIHHFLDWYLKPLLDWNERLKIQEKTGPLLF
jgi:hypothetical protein